MAKIIKHTQVQREELNEVAVLFTEPVSSFNEEQIAALKQEAYEQGYLKGQKEAIELAHRQMDELKTRMEQMLASIPLALTHNRLDMQKELVSMCLFIVQSYFVAQSVDPQLLETQINQLLTQINNQQTIELHLHPHDLKMLQKGLIKLIAVKNEITIKNEESLALGGFIIKTPHGLFDASLEKQLDKLKHYLLSIRTEEEPCS